MVFPRNIRIFLKELPLKRMRGEDIFLSIAFFLSGGKTDVEIKVREVKKHWSKSVVGKNYNSAYPSRAMGWIHSTGIGRFVLTDEGVSHMQELLGEVPTSSTALVVFRQGSAHSFDKFLRSVFKKALKKVEIADTYVDGSLFDALLDEISTKISTRFVYGNDVGGFVTRARRFMSQYKLKIRKSKEFHTDF